MISAHGTWNVPAGNAFGHVPGMTTAFRGCIAARGNAYLPGLARGSSALLYADLAEVGQLGAQHLEHSLLTGVGRLQDKFEDGIGSDHRRLR